MHHLQPVKLEFLSKALIVCNNLVKFNQIRLHLTNEPVI